MAFRGSRPMLWNPMVVTGLAAAALLPCAATAVLAQARGPAATVARIGPLSVGVDSAAEGITAVFQVTNGATHSSGVRGRLALPVGWRLVTPTVPALLAPRETELRILRVAIPGAAAAGTYVLHYHVSTDDGTEIDRDSLAVVVRVRHAAELRLVAAPKLVLAGDAYVASFTVRNTGNSEAPIRLDVASTRGLLARAGETAFRLAAGASRTVRVDVQTDRGERDVIRHRVDVRAQSGSDSTGAAVANSVVEVLPDGGGGASRFRRVPMQLGLRSSTLSQLPMAEVSASGLLSERGGTRLDLFVRTPPHGETLYGERDEYRLAITAPRYELRLGDDDYSPSPLTSVGRLGFGGSGRIVAGRLSAGGFAYRDRWSYAATRGAGHGAFADLRVARRSTLGVNYLDDRGRGGGETWTVRGMAAPFAPVRADVEYGAGATDAGRATALSVSVTGTHPRVGYSGVHQRAGQNYPGRLRGSAYDDVSFWARPSRRLSLSGQFVDQASGARPGSGTDSTLFGQPDYRYDWYFQPFRTYRSYQGRIGFAERVSAEYQHRAAQSRLAIFPVDGREDLVRLGLGSSIGGVRLWGGLELGNSRHGVDGRRQPFQRYTVRSGFSRRRGSLSASVEQLNGATLYYPLPQDRSSAMLSGQLQLADSRLDLAWNGTRSGRSMEGAASVLDGGISQELASGHRLGLRVRVLSLGSPILDPTLVEAGQSSGGGIFGIGPLDTRSLAQISYTVPWGAPVGLSRTSARVRGRIYDAETGRPMGNTVVRLGDRAARSNADGRVTFSGLAPDTYFLRLDADDLGPGRVTVQENPLPVAARRGATTTLAVGVVRGSRLSGTIRVFDWDEQGGADRATRGLIAAAPARSLVLALSRDGETLRRLADADGRFVFADVRAGRWALTLASGELPEHHYLERDTVELVIAPGESASVALRILPRLRPIRMLPSVDVVRPPDASVGGTRPVAAPAAAPAARSLPARRVRRTDAPAPVVLGPRSARGGRHSVLGQSLALL